MSADTEYVPGECEECGEVGLVFLEETDKGEQELCVDCFEEYVQSV